MQPRLVSRSLVSGGELTGLVTLSPLSPLFPPTSVASWKSSVRARNVVLALTDAHAMLYVPTGAVMLL